MPELLTMVHSPHIPLPSMAPGLGMLEVISLTILLSNEYLQAYYPFVCPINF